MTTDELVKYYADLLILQYKNKPNAYATVQAVVKPLMMDQLPLQVLDALNIDTAVGAQLDIIGKYVGVSRRAVTFSGPVTLSDSDFRMMVKLKAIQNNAGSSLSVIQDLLAVYFQGKILVFDYQDMHMSYLFDSSIGGLGLAEVFLKNGVLPRPMGVQLGLIIYADNITQFFGFRTYESPGYNVTGFNNYTSYATDHPWLSYANAI
jgi:hypothetical protein